MKTDQTGDKAKYSGHLYANPCCPLICPVLALVFYFSCCCNLPKNGQSQLFPGWDQYQRFSEMLSCLIQDHEAEVSELGVNPKMIGTHSIRKGAVTYMSSLPGGPSISSVCIHAGWTMGTVKDLLMTNVCRSLSGDVAIIADAVCVPDWGKTYSAQQFPMFDDVPQFLHLKLMCLASMVKHHRFIVGGLILTMLCWQVGNYSEMRGLCISWIIILIALLLLTHGPPMKDHSWGFLPMLLSSKNSTL